MRQILYLHIFAYPDGLVLEQTARHFLRLRLDEVLVVPLCVSVRGVGGVGLVGERGGGVTGLESDTVVIVPFTSVMTHQTISGARLNLDCKEDTCHIMYIHIHYKYMRGVP